MSNASTATPIGVPLAVWPKAKHRTLERRIVQEFSTTIPTTKPAIVDLRSTSPTQQRDLADTLKVLAKRSQPGRVIAIITEHTRHPANVDPVSTATHTACDVGLVYLQHIVVLDCSLQDFSQQAAHSARHRRAHIDVIVTQVRGVANA